VEQRVRFIGLVKGPLLAELYSAADVFVMPSTGEGFGIAFLEAMASGTPAIGLDVAGARDALGDGELGVSLTEAGLSDTLVRALNAPKPSPVALADAVRARFGSGPFGTGVKLAVARALGAS
jgi:phosphatidyl-myo-inositol dimannoside synthase